MSKSKRARDKARAEAHARRQSFCLDRTRTDSTGRLPCCLKHSHETCLVRWFDRTSTCPFCHTPLCPIYKNQPPLPVGHGLPFHLSIENPTPLPTSSPLSGTRPPPPRPGRPIDWDWVRANIPRHMQQPPGYHANGRPG